MITDPWRTEYLPKRETWILKRGPETVYDEERYLREWECEAAAKIWAEDNLTRPFEWEA